jgi:outer membrane protein OmpA-like peptidoglycan-associated protein
VKVLLLLLPLILARPLPVQGQGLNIFSEDEEDSTDLREARRKLKALEKQIKRKEIPPIEFEFNSAVLRPYSKTTLEMVADLMFRYRRFKLFVGGHTCDIGSDEYNLWLSQKRAESVKDYLVQLGVMGEFVRAKGYGETRPLVPNEHEENRKKNRRVEFQILTRWWKSIY